MNKVLLVNLSRHSFKQGAFVKKYRKSKTKVDDEDPYELAMHDAGKSKKAQHVGEEDPYELAVHHSDDPTYESSKNQEEGPYALATDKTDPTYIPSNAKDDDSPYALATDRSMGVNKVDTPDDESPYVLATDTVTIHTKNDSIKVATKAADQGTTNNDRRESTVYEMANDRRETAVYGFADERRDSTPYALADQRKGSTYGFESEGPSKQQGVPSGGHAVTNPWDEDDDDEENLPSRVSVAYQNSRKN